MSATASYCEHGGKISRTVAFVILTWNSEGYVRACLESVLGLGDMCAAAYVVDNGSTDGTLDSLVEIAASDGRLHVLPQGRNLGTTVSRNIAIREALAMSPRPSYICVLDSDTVANEAAIGSAVDALESDPAIAVAGPTLAGGDGSEQLSGRNLPTLGIKFGKAWPLGRVAERAAEAEVPEAPVIGGVQDVGYLLSACWVTPVWAWERVGLLDEAIFYAPEDVDWCLRCHEAGYRVVRSHGSSMTHLYQRISKKRLLSKTNWEHMRGLAHYFRKHGYLLRAPELGSAPCGGSTLKDRTRG